jgi:hypothetical protein
MVVRRLLMIVALAAVVLASTACTGGYSSAERHCGTALLADWSDGRIDRTYPGPCYLAAIAALPEDLRAYSSARDDITRAMQSAAPSRQHGTP